MFTNVKYKVLLFIPLMIITACNQQRNAKHNEDIKEGDVKKVFTDVNKALLESENEDIDDYIARHKWKMEKTESGVRYSIYKRSNGERAKNGKIVVLKYELRLINDYLCYSSNTDGLKEFLIGRSDEPKGLEEIINLMNVGEKAKIIVPSHLGYGLLGDRNLIPKKATLIYDIELIELK